MILADTSRSDKKKLPFDSIQAGVIDMIDMITSFVYLTLNKIP